MQQLPIDPRTENFFKSLKDKDILKIKSSSSISEAATEKFKSIVKKTLLGFGLVGVVVLFANVSNIMNTKVDLDSPKFVQMNKDNTIKENLNLEMNKKEPNKYLVAMEKAHMNLKYMSMKDKYDYGAVSTMVNTVKDTYHSGNLNQFYVDLTNQLKKLQEVADVTNKKDKIYAIGQVLNIIRDKTSIIKLKTLDLSDPQVRKLLNDKEINSLLKQNKIEELVKNEDVKDYLAKRNITELKKMNSINTIPIDINEIMAEYKNRNVMPKVEKEKSFSEFVDVVLPSKDKIKQNLNKYIDEEKENMSQDIDVVKDFLGLKK